MGLRPLRGPARRCRARRALRTVGGSGQDVRISPYARTQYVPEPPPMPVRSAAREAGRKPHHPWGVPAIPSTWRSPITPGQGARKPNPTPLPNHPGPLTRCDSPEGGRRDGRHTTQTKTLPNQPETEPLPSRRPARPARTPRRETQHKATQEKPLTSENAGTNPPPVQTAAPTTPGRAPAKSRHRRSSDGSNDVHTNSPCAGRAAVSGRRCPGGGVLKGALRTAGMS